MFCKSCGKKIDDDSQFCSYCGTKQSIISKPIIENQNKVIELEDSKIDNFKESFDLQNKTEKDLTGNKVSNESQYDLSYSKEIEATVVGVLILALSIFLYNFPFEFDNIDSIHIFRIISIVGNLALRILIASWIVNIANRQNRNTFSWGLFAFIFPSISLIMIGLLKKIKYHVKVNSALTPIENFYALEKEGDDFIKQERYKEAELIYQYIYENYELNDSIIFKLADLYFKNEKFNESESLLKLLVDSEKYSDITNYYLGFIAMKKGKITNALEHLEISSNKNFLKSTILKNIILQDKIQKISFENQKKEFGISNIANVIINIQIETLSFFELSFKPSQTNLEIFENYLVINFFESNYSFKKESFIFNYRMINNFERIENTKYAFVFNDGKSLILKFNTTLDIAKGYEKTIVEKILYFKSSYS